MASEPVLHVIGTITRSQESGVQLDVEPGVWFNRSKPEYDRTAGRPFPPVHATVDLEYAYGARQEKRYIVGWTNLMSKPTYAPEQSQGFDGAAVRTSAQTAHLRDDKPVVTRLACLNSALALVAQFGVPDPESSEYPEGQILDLAERLVAWAVWDGAED